MEKGHLDVHAAAARLLDQPEEADDVDAIDAEADLSAITEAGDQSRDEVVEADT